ncbi:MAG: hypothetical protein ACOCYR_07645, partial [Erythrobacter sp.]
MRTLRERSGRSSALFRPLAGPGACGRPVGLAVAARPGMHDSMTFALPGFDLDRFVRDTLAEDLGE